MKFLLRVCKYLFANRQCRITEPDAMAAVRKFGFDYVNFVKECWIHVSVRPLTSLHISLCLSL